MQWKIVLLLSIIILAHCSHQTVKSDDPFQNFKIEFEKSSFQEKISLLRENERKGFLTPEIERYLLYFINNMDNPSRIRVQAAKNIIQNGSEEGKIAVLNSLKRTDKKYNDKLITFLRQELPGIKNLIIKILSSSDHYLIKANLIKTTLSENFEPPAELYQVILKMLFDPADEVVKNAVVFLGKKGKQDSMKQIKILLNSTTKLTIRLECEKALALMRFRLQKIAKKHVPLGFYEIEDKRKLKKDKDVITILKNRITAELSTSGLFDLLERDKLEHALKEMQLSSSDLFNEKEAIKLGQLISAKYIMYGQLYPINEGKIELSMKILAVEKGKFLGTFVVNGYENNLNSLINKLIIDILDYYLSDSQNYAE